MKESRYCYARPIGAFGALKLPFALDVNPEAVYTTGDDEEGEYAEVRDQFLAAIDGVDDLELRLLLRRNEWVIAADPFAIMSAEEA